MSGCIFLAEAMFSEDVGEITQKLRAISGLKEQLEFVHVDRPFDWDKSSVFKAFPHLVAIGGDALHLVFEASGCFGESMKPGIVVDLKKIQHKWAAGGSTKWLLSPFFRSADGPPRALSCYERACASASNLSKATAKKLLEAVNPDVPYHSRAQYLKYLAAILVSHPQVLRRKSADGTKTLREVVRGAMDLRYIEYMANAARFRAQTNIAREELAPGTTGNEGAHFDLKGWVWNVRSRSKSATLAALRFWVMSQHGRFHAHRTWMIEHSTDTFNLDPLSHMLLKIQRHKMSLGDATEQNVKRGLSRDEVKSANMMKRPCHQPMKRRLSFDDVKRGQVFKRPCREESRA